MRISRRALLLAAGAAPLARSARAEVSYATVTPRPLVFPRDHGAHPEYRTEWWYLTGWLDARGQESIGFQVTFFRVRTTSAPGPSRFSPTQLVIAHAAIASPERGALVHDERAQRVGFGLVEASTTDTDIRLDRWRFVRDAASGEYRATIPARSFDLTLSARPTQPLLLQGAAGYSRKGPAAAQASHYYSAPQLAVTGTIAVAGATATVTGTAWLDHEWSSTVMAPGAAGWDWAGINLADGGALMAFRMRAREGRAWWAGGTLRGTAGRVRSFAPVEIRFDALRTWRSPRTGAAYPVAMKITAGDVVLTLEPLIDDQELDSRASTGTIYWEGAMRALASGRTVGQGYLELTGYGAPLRL